MVDTPPHICQNAKSCIASRVNVKGCKNHLEGERVPDGMYNVTQKNLTVLQIYETNSLKRMREKSADLSNSGNEWFVNENKGNSS